MNFLRFFAQCPPGEPVWILYVDMFDGFEAFCVHLGLEGLPRPANSNHTLSANKTVAYSSISQNKQMWAKNP